MTIETIIYLGGIVFLAVLLIILMIARGKPVSSGMDVNEFKKERDEARSELKYANQQLVSANQELAMLSGIKDERDRLSDEVKTLRLGKSEAELRAATLSTQMDAARKHNDEKLTELKEARDKLNESFRLTANQIIETSGEKLNKQSNETLATLLKPLREQLDGFQRKVNEDAEKRVGQTTEITTLVKTLHDDARQMGEDAKNLANALRSQSKVQGDWGELVLSSILERAGLREGHEFHSQDSTTDHDGKRQRSDIVVDMPNSQKLVIDSKVSLTAFERCVNADSDQERESALKLHVASVRKHVKDLSDKDYPSRYPGVSFTLMFIPLEGAASLALQSDSELAAHAWERDIMITTPTTLMMAMRTVQNLWSVERQNQNAKEIADRAGKLYDKFEGFVSDLDKIGSRLNQAQEAYSGARSKLVLGSGNLVRQAELLKQMGATTKKSLPNDLTSMAGADTELLPSPNKDSEDV